MNHHSNIFLCTLVFLLPLSGSTQPQDKTVKQNSRNGISSGVVPVEGAELHYIIEGKGLSCLVIGHSESQRLILSKQLRNHFRFVFMDLRHDALSNCSMEISEITLDTYLDDIDTVRKALQLNRCAIFGHSHHALIALEYARKYPSRVSHVIMTGCKPCTTGPTVGDEFWESDASNERKMLFAQNWEEFLDQRREMSAKERHVATLVAMAPKLLYDPTEDMSFIKAVEAIDNNVNVYLHYQLVILKDYDIAKRPKQVAAPVFLVLGRYDYVSPYILWDKRKNFLPNLSYNLFHKSSHFPMIEEQELFDKRLIEWISIMHNTRGPE